jgi:hypothetical protein
LGGTATSAATLTGAVVTIASAKKSVGLSTRAATLKAALAEGRVAPRLTVVHSSAATTTTAFTNGGITLVINTTITTITTRAATASAAVKRTIPSLAAIARQTAATANVRRAVVQRATAAAGRVIAFEGAVLDREIAILEIDPATCTHSTPAARGAVATVDPKVLDVCIPDC